MNLEWLTDNFIELFGAVTGILYVILEVKQNRWLWFVGIVTSAVYVWVFFKGKLYADMSLQGYYLVISFWGWYWWTMGTGHRAQGIGQERENMREEEGEKNERERGRVGEREKRELEVTRIKTRTAIILALVFVVLYAAMYMILSRLTDSPVPQWDSFITSLSIVATWMLAKKIYEHWYLWIIVNTVSALLFISRGLYPTVILYSVYCLMSFVGLIAWKKTIKIKDN
jgi:nicotinamide mononucleotide transporter